MGVCHSDVLLRQFQISQFIDSPQLVNLESVLVQMSPKECLVLVSGHDAHLESVRQMLQRNAISITERKRGFSTLTLSDH